MPEGGAYVYDSWATPLLFNPNIVLLDKYQVGYGRSEGGSGRPITIDHPLHIALFENNTQMDRPPHLRKLSANNPLLPPVSFTPQHRHRLETVLNLTRGDIEQISRRAHRGGTNNSILQRVAVECRPVSPPSQAYDVLYDEEAQRRAVAALPPLSPPSQEMDEYGNIIEDSEDPDSRSRDQSLDSYGNTVSAELERSYSANYPNTGWTGRTDSVDSNGWPILNNTVPATSAVT
jgi:hypothetical protein